MKDYTRTGQDTNGLAMQNGWVSRLKPMLRVNGMRLLNFWLVG